MSLVLNFRGRGAFLKGVDGRNFDANRGDEELVGEARGTRSELPPGEFLRYFEYRRRDNMELREKIKKEIDNMPEELLHCLQKYLEDIVKEDKQRKIKEKRFI